MFWGQRGPVLLRKCVWGGDGTLQFSAQDSLSPWGEVCLMLVDTVTSIILYFEISAPERQIASSLLTIAT